VLPPAPQGSVLRVLDLTGPAGVFSFHVSVAAAAAGLGSARYAPQRPVVGAALARRAASLSTSTG
jgi:hypothetical protein